MSKNAHRAAMRTLAVETLAVLREIRDRMPERRPESCCGNCPPVVGGGYDCTCEGNPRCEGEDYPDAEGLATLRGEGDEPSATQDVPSGRIGWLRFAPGDDRCYLVLEATGGWSGDDSDAPDYYPAEDYPDATFTPIATLPEGHVAVRREDVEGAMDFIPSVLTGFRARLRAALEGSQS